MALPLSTTAWEERINAAWRGSAQSFILAGQLLIECKETVPQGSFLAMLKSGRLDFKPRMAEYLMAIAEDPRLSDAKNFAILPQRMMTLYDLRKLDDEAFYSALQSGKIHKTMKRAEAKKLLPPKARPDAIDVEHEDISVTSIAAVKVTKQIDAIMESADEAKSGDQRSRSNEPESLRNPSISGDQQQSADEADAPEHCVATAPGSAVPEGGATPGLRAADDREVRDSGHHEEEDFGEIWVFETELSRSSPVAVAMSSAERLKFLLVELHRFVEDECDTEQMAREYDGDFTPGKIAAGLNWLDDFYTEFVKVEEGRAAAE